MRHNQPQETIITPQPSYSFSSVTTSQSPPSIPQQLPPCIPEPTISPCLMTLTPKQITLPRNLSPPDHPDHSQQREKQRLAGEFIKKVKREKRHFDGRILLRKQQEEMVKRRRQNEMSMEKEERVEEERRRKLGQIFENLEEYQRRKQRRKDEIEKFKKDLTRLQQEKPLYQIKQEEFIQKHELPIIMERQQKLEQVKQSRKPIDWQKQMVQFQNRIFQLKQQRSNKLTSSTSQSKCPLPELYKSRFYTKASQSHIKRDRDQELKTEVEERRKRYSQEVKIHNEPTGLQVRVNHLSDYHISTPKRLIQPREEQNTLGNQYLKYSKGFSGGRRHKTEKSVTRKETIDTSEQYSTASPQKSTSFNSVRSYIGMASGPISTIEDQQKYLSDIRLKLDILRCMVQ